MARRSPTWIKKALGYVTPSGFGASILLRGINRYINFGSIFGASGYGFRDNDGVLEFKDQDGNWAAFGTGTGTGTGGISLEEAVDAVAAVIAAGTHTGIEITYNDADDTLSFALTGEEYSTAEKNKVANVPSNTNTALAAKLGISDLVNNLTSTATNRPLTAAQGKVLKDAIDTINTLIGSDETTLDTLQEIVDFIEINRDSLDNLSIASIAGLQVALNAKQATLVSGTNIRTVNGQTLLGNTNLVTPDTNTTYAEITEAEILAATATTARALSGRRVGYLMSLLMRLTGNQTVAGIKTFSSSPVVPTPTTDFEAATKKYVDDNAGLGGGTSTGATDISCKMSGASKNSSTANSLQVVDFSTTDFDTDLMHDNLVNNSRITIKTAGKYQINATSEFANNKTATIVLRKNGSIDLAGNAGGNSGNGEFRAVSFMDAFEVGDYIETLIGSANSNTDVTNIAFSAHKLF